MTILILHGIGGYAGIHWQKWLYDNKVNKNLKQAFVIYGDNDPYVPQKELKFLANNLLVKSGIITNGGHLNTDSGYGTFPRLLEIIKSIK